MAPLAKLCPTLFYCSLFVGVVVCQISNELDVDDLEKQVQNIPGLENFNSSKLPTEEDLNKVLREKCDKNGGGEEAFNALKNQQNSVKECLELYLNATQIKLEIDKAKETGSMDEVFGEYCKKYPEIYGCFDTAVSSAQSCLDENEKDVMYKALNITHELKDFICFKDGDRIAMFIAEGGIECLESKNEALQECVNKTVGARIPTDLSVNNLPMLLFSERDCRDFNTVRACINVELEKCPQSTPANIVDAFFKFLAKQIPCSSMLNDQGKSKDTSPGSASTISVSFFFVMLSVLASKFL